MNFIENFVNAGFIPFFVTFIIFFYKNKTYIKRIQRKNSKAK